MSNGKNGGDISVSMGDGNTIGQIGHIFHRPPPAPNAIIQNDVDVGILDGLITETDTTVSFASLHHNGKFNVNEPFWLHGSPGILLKVQSSSISTSVSFGRVNEESLRNVLLQKMGRRA